MVIREFVDLPEEAVFIVDKDELELDGKHTVLRKKPLTGGGESQYNAVGVGGRFKDLPFFIKDDMEVVELDL